MADDVMTGMVPPLFADVPKSVSFKKLRKRIVRSALHAVDQYGMVDRARTGDVFPTAWFGGNGNPFEFEDPKQLDSMRAKTEADVADTLLGANVG